VAILGPAASDGASRISSPQRMVCKGRLRRPSDASTRSVVRAGNDGWSLYGAQRSQPLATGGKWEGAENGSDNGRFVAVGCDQLPESFVVSRGSTVRVRKRASDVLRQTGIPRYLFAIAVAIGSAFGWPWVSDWNAVLGRQSVVISVAACAALLTDEYPTLRLEDGNHVEGTTAR
jgi:hypothetical protein